MNTMINDPLEGEGSERGRLAVASVSWWHGLHRELSQPQRGAAPIRGVYGLFDRANPFAIRYAGISNDVELRVSQHRGSVAGRLAHIELGAILLQEMPAASRAELLEAECEWIDRLREYGMGDLNRAGVSQ